MTDDPREVLKAAGVECAEVDKYLDYDAMSWCHADPSVTVEPGLAAILALSRIVLRLSGQLNGAEMPREDLL